MQVGTAQIKGVEHVVLIGSDGFSAEVLRENPHLFPNITNLIKQGSSTLECRSVLPSSSAVNWASHLMGAGPELHGYTEWGSKTPDLPSREVTKNGTFPCIVWATREKYPEDEIGVVYSWDGIGYLFDTIAASYNYFAPNDEQVTAKSIEYLKKQPRFAFFYLAEPDGTGHSKGWQGEQYKKMCQTVDKHVGEIVAGVEAAGMKDNTIIVFVSDHGGLGTGHGGKTMSEMQTPYVVVGPGVKQNYKIPESMMNYDDAATLAYILGVDCPQVWVGRPVMSIFEKQPQTTPQEVGRNFNISIDGNPTTGYVWSVKSLLGASEDSTPNIALVNSKYITDKAAEEMVGAAGKYNFKFKAAPGNYTVTMQYKRPWEAQAAQTKSYEFRVK